MFSDGTYDEIGRLTIEALRQIHASQVIDRVTVIRGYVQILSRTRAPGAYERRMIIAVQELAELAKQYQKAELVDALEALVARMDQEREP
jgi:hypothetical protein